jgi:hypothetical protein
MEHFWICGILMQIALLKWCAAAALTVINADKGTYSVSSKDSFIDNRDTI